MQKSAKFISVQNPIASYVKYTQMNQVIGWRCCIVHKNRKTYCYTYHQFSSITLRQTFKEIKRAFQNECCIERRASRNTTLKHLENAAENH